MKDNITEIQLKWDRYGRISHKITGKRLPHPLDDPELWILTPSAILFVFNQFGVLRPSNGLILCSDISDIAFYRKNILKPINPTLKQARIHLNFNTDGSVGFYFYPEHNIIHNSDSLEEGFRQLVTNYYQYAYNRINDYYQINTRLFTIVGIYQYYDFLNTMINKNEIGPGEDHWNIEFSQFSAELRNIISKMYVVPKKGDNDWYRKTTQVQEKDEFELKEKNSILCSKLGFI